MEPVRPSVDRFVLDLIAKRPFAIAHFHETARGYAGSRLSMPVARELATTVPEWGRSVGRIVEDVARMLECERQRSSNVAMVQVNPPFGRHRPIMTSLPFSPGGVARGQADCRQLKVRIVDGTSGGAQRLWGQSPLV